MVFHVVGIYEGTSKANGNPFWMLHCVEVERQQKGLRGYAVGTYFCTKEVADSIVPGKYYNLDSGFGSKTVIGAQLVDSDTNK